MTYQEALEYIHSINWAFCKPGLERIKKLCQRLGDPQTDLQFIHVAGTNGKGSFCAMLDSVLREAGLKVGLFTSPYIRFFNERMCVNGTPISNEELAEITAYVRPVTDGLKDKPTEFEMITAIAFEYFYRHECDVVILEAGMGGRLDSTNIIENPILSVITGIALDHTSFLGNTVEAIAAEKAGIIKAGRPVLFGGDDSCAAEVIRDKAREQGSRYELVDYRLLRNLRGNLEGSVFDFGDHRDIQISLLGTYQPRNAAVVIRAVEMLREMGLTVSDAALRVGLRNAMWHGRFEIISKDPLILFDGAHNPQGIGSAVESIRYYFGDKKIYVLTGVLRDKDYQAIATDLATVSDRAFVMTPDNPRALSASEYADTLRQKGMEATAYGSLTEALEAARGAARRDSVPLICLGSLYVYSSLIQLI